MSQVKITCNQRNRLVQPLCECHSLFVFPSSSLAPKPDSLVELNSRKHLGKETKQFVSLIKAILLSLAFLPASFPCPLDSLRSMRRNLCYAASCLSERLIRKGGNKEEEIRKKAD